MGGKQSISFLSEPKFTANLKFLYQTYQANVAFIRQSNLFASRNNKLEEAVQRYLQDQHGYEPQSRQLQAIVSTHKLYPLNYRTNKITAEKLIKACLTHHTVVSSFCPVSFTNCYKEYVAFLCMSRQYPSKNLVPNNQADFLWRAHMQDHEAYVVDSYNFLNRVLERRNDQPAQTSSEYSEDQQNSQAHKKILFQIVGNFSEQRREPTSSTAYSSIYGSNTTSEGTDSNESNSSNDSDSTQSCDSGSGESSSSCSGSDCSD